MEQILLCFFIRDAGDGFYAVRHNMCLDYDFVKQLWNGLPYKYVVYSPKMKTVGHQFEYLHGAPYENPRKNRLLKVPNEKIKGGGKKFSSPRVIACLPVYLYMPFIHIVLEVYTP